MHIEKYSALLSRLFENDSRDPVVLAADGTAVLDIGIKVEELEELALDVRTTTAAAVVILK